MEDNQETMRIPEVIMYNGFPIRTQYVPNLLSDREHYGEYCTRTMKIDIEPNLSPERAALTWCHEYVETIINVCHLDIDEESTKQDIAIGIYQLMMQHKKFFCKQKEG